MVLEPGTPLAACDVLLTISGKSGPDTKLTPSPWDRNTLHVSVPFTTMIFDKLEIGCINMGATTVISFYIHRNY